MAGNWKFGLSYITRDDIAALTKEVSEIGGVLYIMDVDADEVEGTLQDVFAMEPNNYRRAIFVQH